ncbi:hypothetical protein F2P81_018578 [Scophthalmus maximus]|uniref:Uncharacterized protein n=1 Tax=Scophthalmus maximus TaxID=52904 RepID=A0A6A4S536_SCOMX|nr:hypothetical protein F2P81_018578 [Scophthalmus maximus]
MQTASTVVEFSKTEERSGVQFCRRRDEKCRRSYVDEKLVRASFFCSDAKTTGNNVNNEKLHRGATTAEKHKTNVVSVALMFVCQVHGHRYRKRCSCCHYTKLAGELFLHPLTLRLLSALLCGPSSPPCSINAETSVHNSGRRRLLCLRPLANSDTGRGLTVPPPGESQKKEERKKLCLLVAAGCNGPFQQRTRTRQSVRGTRDGVGSVECRQRPDRVEFCFLLLPLNCLWCEKTHFNQKTPLVNPVSRDE